MRRRVVILLGNPRSGSTLLGAMLGSHTQAALLGEMNDHARDLRRRGALGQTGESCVVCPGPCPVWDEKVPPDFVARRYGRQGGERTGFYEELSDAIGAQVLVDTSKKPAWARERLRDRHDARAMDLRLVLLVRAAVNSWARKRSGEAFGGLARQWARNVQDAADLYSEFDPARRAMLRYEDLVADPAGALAGSCAFLGLPFEPVMAEFWTHEHHWLGGNAGTRSLVLRWRREHGLPARAPRRAKAGYGIYDEVPYGLFEDRRWHAEMDAARLAAFEEVAGELNRSLGYA